MNIKNNYLILSLSLMTTVLPKSIIQKTSSLNNTIACTSRILNSNEKHAYFASISSIRSHKLAIRYDITEIAIQNKTKHPYVLELIKNVTIEKPETIAQKLNIKQAWVPIAAGVASTIVALSVCNFFFFPGLIVGICVGACTANIGRHAKTKKNRTRIISSMLDPENEILIPACSSLKKMIVYKKKQKKKPTELVCKNIRTQKKIIFALETKKAP